MSYIGQIPLPQATEERIERTATAGQTSFTGLTYVSGHISTFINGVKLDNSDFTATDGTTVTLGTGASAGDTVSFVSTTQTSALVALPLKDSAGNNILSESSGVVTLENVTIGDSITLSQGTWTPTFTDSTGADLVTTYGTRNATYTRIGNVVFFNVDIIITSYTNSSTSALYLDGLPKFGVTLGTPHIGSNGFPSGIVSFFSGLSNSFSSGYSIHWVLQNSGRIAFYYAAGTTSIVFQQQWLTGAGRFIFGGRYYLGAIT